MPFNQSIIFSTFSRLFKTVSISVVIAVSLTSCAEQSSMTPVAAAHTSFTQITGLKTPESVVQNKDGKIYVSEINKFGKYGDGQISVIENGQVSLLIDRLDDPKGLVIIDDFLYVTDNDKILKINLTGTAQKEIFVPMRAFPKPPQFLNDLEADPQGNLYVSDSGDILNTGKGGVIYKINPAGEVTKLIDGVDNPLVMAPNGLLADDTGQYLLFVDFTSGILYTLNTETGELSDINEGFGGGDGLVHHSSGTMYVSDWKNGRVFAVGVDGEITKIGRKYLAPSDIALTKDEHYLMVPDMKAGELNFIDLTTADIAK